MASGFRIKVEQVHLGDEKLKGKYALKIKIPSIVDLKGKSFKSKKKEKICKINEDFFIPFEKEIDDIKKYKIVVELWRTKTVFLTKKTEFSGLFEISFQDLVNNEKFFQDNKTIRFEDEKLQRISSNEKITLSITNDKLKMIFVPKIVIETSSTTITTTTTKITSSSSSQPTQITTNTTTTTDKTTNDKTEMSVLTNMDDLSKVSTSSFNSISEEEEKKQEDKKEFTEISKIGAGGFGEVYLVKSKKSGDLLALKKVFCSTDEEMNTAMKEVFMLKELSFDNIIKYNQVFFESSKDDPKKKFCLCFTMPYYKEGDLEHLLKKRAETGVPFSPNRLKNYFNQLLNSLRYLKNKSIIHRDIKPSNIYLDDSYEKLVLADFGLIRDVGGMPSDLQTTQNIAGTPLYLPPEVYVSKRSPTFACDMFSMGCVFYYMMTLAYPVSEKPFCLECYQPNFLKDVLKNVTVNYSQSFGNLITRMLEPDPSKRITVEEALLYIQDNLSQVSEKEPETKSQEQLFSEKIDNMIKDFEIHDISNDIKLPEEVNEGPALEVQKEEEEEIKDNLKNLTSLEISEGSIDVFEAEKDKKITSKNEGNLPFYVCVNGRLNRSNGNLEPFVRVQQSGYSPKFQFFFCVEDVLVTNTSDKSVFIEAEAEYLDSDGTTWIPFERTYYNQMFYNGAVEPEVFYSREEEQAIKLDPYNSALKELCFKTTVEGEMGDDNDLRRKIPKALPDPLKVKISLTESKTSKKVYFNAFFKNKFTNLPTKESIIKDLRNSSENGELISFTSCDNIKKSDRWVVQVLFLHKRANLVVNGKGNVGARVMTYSKSDLKRSCLIARETGITSETCIRQTSEGCFLEASFLFAKDPKWKERKNGIANNENDVFIHAIKVEIKTETSRVLKYIPININEVIEPIVKQKIVMELDENENKEMKKIDFEHYDKIASDEKREGSSEFKEDFIKPTQADNGKDKDVDGGLIGMELKLNFNKDLKIKEPNSVISHGRFNYGGLIYIFYDLFDLKLKNLDSEPKDKRQFLSGRIFAEYLDPNTQKWTPCTRCKLCVQQQDRYGFFINKEDNSHSNIINLENGNVETFGLKIIFPPIKSPEPNETCFGRARMPDSLGNKPILMKLICLDCFGKSRTLSFEVPKKPILMKDQKAYLEYEGVKEQDFIYYTFCDDTSSKNRNTFLMTFERNSENIPTSIKLKVPGRYLNFNYSSFQYYSQLAKKQSKEEMKINDTIFNLPHKVKFRGIFPKDNNYRFCAFKIILKSTTGTVTSIIPIHFDKINLKKEDE